MNVGAFCVVSHLAGAGERNVTLDDYAGLSRRQPWLAAMLSLFLLSLIGIPSTVGFLAKFYVFNAALKENMLRITLIEAVNNAVAPYDLRSTIVRIYFHQVRRDVAQASG